MISHLHFSKYVSWNYMKRITYLYEWQTLYQVKLNRFLYCRTCQSLYNANLFSIFTNALNCGYSKWYYSRTPLFFFLMKNHLAGFSSVQSLSHVWLFETPWTAAYQASLSLTNCQSLLKFMSLKQWSHANISSSVVPSPAAFSLSQHQGLFLWVSFSHQVDKVLEFQIQHQYFQWIFRTDFL